MAHLYQNKTSTEREEIQKTKLKKGGVGGH